MQISCKTGLFLAVPTHSLFNLPPRWNSSNTLNQLYSFWLYCYPLLYLDVRPKVFYSPIFNTLGEPLDRVGKNRVTRGFTFNVTLVSTFYFGWVTLALKKQDKKLGQLQCCLAEFEPLMPDLQLDMVNADSSQKISCGLNSQA